MTPFAETFGALDELVPRGKVRYVGHSNLEAAQVEEVDALAREHGLERPVSAQNQLLAAAPRARARPAARVRAARHRRAAVLPAGERIADREVPPRRTRPEGTRLENRDEVFTDEAFDRIEALEVFAAERGITLLDVAIGGLLAQPAIASVIAGATRPEQVRANAAAGNWEPSPDDSPR